MARPLRTDFHGAVHHVTSRGNEQRDIFRSDEDRLMFLDLLAQTVRRFQWSLTAWVLMSNHFHLLVQTPANLSRGMHWLNGRYASWVNRRYKRCGHLFQGRFKAILVERETYFEQVLRYVVLNPVRAAMVERPEAYAWSSYRATAGLMPAPEWLDVRSALDPFAQDAAAAAAFYRDYVAQNTDSNTRLWDSVIHGIYLGSGEWAKRIRQWVESRPRASEHPKFQRAIGRPKMHEIVDAVARTTGQAAAAIRNGHGGVLRRLVAWIGFNEGWVTLTKIAAVLRLRSTGHVSGMIREAEAEFGRSTSLLATLDASVALLRA